MTKTDVLQLSAWSPEELPESLTLTRFMLPLESYKTLQDWCDAKRSGKRAHSNIVLAGLSEIIAYFVPRVAFIDSRARYPSGEWGLALYLLGGEDATSDERANLETALNFWLAQIYGDNPVNARTAIAASAQDGANWEHIEVETGMAPDSSLCAKPSNGLLFSALLANIAQQLAGSTVQFPSGERKTLILQTPMSGIYEGVELVAFPPKVNPDKNQLYTEVIKLRMANFPERAGKGIELIAHFSMRNWGPIEYHDKRDSPARSLDVFMPPRTAEAGGFCGYRHSRFRFKATVSNWSEVRKLGAEKLVEARWESFKDKGIYEIIRALTGVNEDSLQPVQNQSGAWVLPRLAPGSGNRYLSGGSGVGWSDKSALAAALDAPLTEIGFARCKPMQRQSIRFPLKSDFAKHTSEEARRTRLCEALRQARGDTHLPLAVLHMRDASLAMVQETIESLLGAPNRKSDTSWAWSDGLIVAFHAMPSGPFGRLKQAADIDQSKMGGLTGAQQAKIRADKQSDADESTREDMRAYLERHLPADLGIGCALLEMPASLQGESLDPYQIGRQVLAEHGLLPKVLLAGEDEEDEKYQFGLLDLLRMLGVSPIDASQLTQDLCAIGVVQRNADANAFGAAQSALLAVRWRSGQLEAAASESGDSLSWEPYPHVALAMLTGGFESQSRKKSAENRAVYERFVLEVLESLNRSSTPTLVLLDSETLRSYVEPLKNSHLMFDALQLDGRRVMPSDWRNLALVRVNAISGELPGYIVDTGAQWVQGFFGWEDASRTAYAAKTKPNTAKDTRSLLRSRNDPETANLKSDADHRKAAALDELCLIFAGDDIETEQCLMLAHRLRSTHVQYRDDTRLPFPLHELRALKKTITS